MFCKSSTIHLLFMFLDPGMIFDNYTEACLLTLHAILVLETARDQVCVFLRVKKRTSG